LGEVFRLTPIRWGLCPQTPWDILRKKKGAGGAALWEGGVCCQRAGQAL